VDRPANKTEEDCRNGYVAGLIAYCRMAAHMEDADATAAALIATRKALRERLSYEFAHPRGGVLMGVPGSRSIFARWRHLTPEVGRFLASYAGPTCITSRSWLRALHLAVGCRGRTYRSGPTRACDREPPQGG